MISTADLIRRTRGMMRAGLSATVEDDDKLYAVCIGKADNVSNFAVTADFLTLLLAAAEDGLAKDDLLTREDGDYIRERLAEATAMAKEIKTLRAALELHRTAAR